jgi:HlyD family secretion protein
MAKRPPIRWIALTGMAIGAAVLLGFLFAPRPLVVDTALVRVGPIAETVADQGTARVRQSYVVSAPIGGRLERLPVEVGDRVDAGKTVVARIRPIASEFLSARAQAQAKAAVNQARSAMAAAISDRERLQVEAARTKRDLERSVALMDKGFESRQALDNARAAADAARTAVSTADAQIRARRADLESALSVLTGPEASTPQIIDVTSPASGVVTQLLQQSARSLLAGTQLVEVGDVKGLEAQIEFLSQDAVRIRPGMRAEIYNWGGAKPIPAEVRLVEPHGYLKISALGVEEQRALVMLQFTGPPSDSAGLAPGYRVWGRVFLRREASAILAPLGALVRDRGGWAVYRIEAGRARLRPIKVGALTDQDAEVVSGLSARDRLVVFPSDEVHDGASVRSR